MSINVQLYMCCVYAMLVTYIPTYSKHSCVHNHTDNEHSINNIGRINGARHDLISDVSGIVIYRYSCVANYTS